MAQILMNMVGYDEKYIKDYTWQNGNMRQVCVSRYKMDTYCIFPVLPSNYIKIIKRTEITWVNVGLSYRTKIDKKIIIFVIKGKFFLSPFRIKQLYNQPTKLFHI